ncbi:MAG: hypothetical protein E7231_16040 [Cellulosilyticum sp.]|nr:hypothetical protein [Cellulosilyticum sp.]
MVPQIGYATENEKSNALEQAILGVKTQIQIPEALSEFEYSENNEKYYLSWEALEGKQSLSVTCEADGDILRYNYYDGLDYSGLASISYEEAKSSAEDFLKQVAKDYASSLKLKEISTPNQDDTYTFNYEWIHEGIKVFNQEVEVNVSKQTGQVVYFSGISYDVDTKFEDTLPKLSLEEAEKAYIEKIGLDLAYSCYTDAEDKEKSYLAYEVANYRREGIRADTGEVIKGINSGGIQYDKGVTEADTADTMTLANGLSEAEQKEVDQRKEFIAQEVIKVQAEAFFPILKEMQIMDTQLSQSNGQYIRRIFFEGKEEENARLVVNAVTGEILSYYYSEGARNSIMIEVNQDGSVGWNAEKANAFVKKIVPDLFESLELHDTIADDNLLKGQNFYYQRKVNDIPVMGDSIRISYDLELKQVTSYEKNWSEASFKKPTSILTKEQVVKQVGLELVYMLEENGEYALAYNHPIASKHLDAFSGKEVNYRGEVIEKEETTGFYTDIKGHPYEKIITSLYDSGIYLDTKKLVPDAPITKGEMLDLIEQLHLDLPEEMSKEGLEQVLTKEEGIYYLVGSTAYSKLAQSYEIFNNPYKDEDIDETLKGYIAIAYGLGWLPQQENLNPKEPLTKAEAMVYLYNVLINE